MSTNMLQRFLLIPPDLLLIALLLAEHAAAVFLHVEAQLPGLLLSGPEAGTEVAVQKPHAVAPGHLLRDLRHALMLLVNTAKGAQIFDSLPLHRRRFDLAEAVAADQALRSPAPVSVDRTKFFDALEQEPFRQVCARFLSLMQPRARAARPLKELLHIPFKKRKDK